MDDNNDQMQEVKISQDMGKIKHESEIMVDSNLNFYSDNFFSDETLLNQILEMNINNILIGSKDDLCFDKICLNSFSRKNESLVSQLKEALEKSSGEVFYEFSGLFENSVKTGIPEVLLREYIDEIRKQANSLNAKMKILKIYPAKNGYIAEIFIRKNSEKIYMDDIYEINIGFYGEEGCGKSTLLSVLIYGCLDNGNGNARKKILTSPQEIVSGKTITISYQIIGFDSENSEITFGTLLKGTKAHKKRYLNDNPNNNKNYNLWQDVMNKSVKIFNFYDLGGSDKAQKISFSMLSSDYLDIIFLCCSAFQGITETTKSYLVFASMFEITPISIITQLDKVTENELEVFLNNYKQLIKLFSKRKIPLVLKNEEEVSTFSKNLNENIHPIFLVSSKTGLGIDLLFIMLKNLNFVDNKYINSLLLSQSYMNFKNFSTMNHSQFDIHDIFMFDKRVIVGGIVNKGNFTIGNQYYLGPDKTGSFTIVDLVDIHCKKNPSTLAYKGQFSSFSLAKNGIFLKFEDIRKGMVLLDVESTPHASYIFEVELTSLENEVKVLKYKYEPVITIRHIRQACKVKPKEEVKTIEDNCFPKKHNNNYHKYDFLSDDNEDNYKPEVRKVKRKAKNSEHVKNTDDIIIKPKQPIKLVLEFKNFPEYINIGDNVIINDNLLRAFGIVIRLIPSKSNEF